jgi:hypothetical protein
MISKAILCGVGILLAVGLSIAQPKSRRHEATAAEAVVQQFQALISSGSLLTPEGWTEADKLFDHSGPYPKNGKIFVMYPGIVGEWPKGEEATLGYHEGVVVESKWGSEYGSIDPNLHYQAPEHGTGTPTSDLYHLLYVGHQWKIAGPLLVRSTTLEKAIEYVTKTAEGSSDLAAKRNARKTVATLKRLKQGHGNACAC